MYMNGFRQSSALVTSMLLRHNFRARPHLLHLLVRKLRTQPLPDYQWQESNYVEMNSLATPREVLLSLRIVC